MRLEFCHRLYSNPQLLPLILFTDEAALELLQETETRNSHRLSHDNLHGTVETNFQRRFFINMWCAMIDEMLVPLL